MNRNWMLLLGVILVTFATAGCEKYALDRQMKELCERDGGSRVFETVELPAHMFDESGYPFPGWRKRPDENRLGINYIYVRKEKIIKNGNPLKGEGRLRRVQVKIIRKSDSKILGETVGYFRAGGDGVVIGHHTSNSCPASGEPIEKLVFVKK